MVKHIYNMVSSNAMSRLFLATALLVILVYGCQTAEEVKESQKSGKGILEGSVFAGPTCPVEGPDMEECEPNPLIDQRISVFDSSQNELASVKTNENGDYRLILPAGTYTVDSKFDGIMFSKDLPMTVTITAGKTTELDISVDTGIRGAEGPGP